MSKTSRSSLRNFLRRHSLLRKTSARYCIASETTRKLSNRTPTLAKCARNRRWKALSTSRRRLTSLDSKMILGTKRSRSIGRLKLNFNSLMIQRILIMSRKALATLRATRRLNLLSTQLRVTVTIAHVSHHNLTERPMLLFLRAIVLSTTLGMLDTKPCNTCKLPRHAKHQSRGKFTSK